MIDDHAVSIHEAGHAVVAYVLGLPVTKAVLHIHASVDGARAYCDIADDKEQSVDDVLVMLCAGSAAELCSARSGALDAIGERVRASAAHDIHEARELNERCTPRRLQEARMREAIERAKQLVVEHAPSIQEVASVLRQHGEIERPAIAAIVQATTTVRHRVEND